MQNALLYIAVRLLSYKLDLRAAYLLRQLSKQASCKLFIECMTQFKSMDYNCVYNGLALDGQLLCLTKFTSILFSYTRNHSRCGATLYGIFTHSLQGGTIFCSELAADLKRFPYGNVSTENSTVYALDVFYIRKEAMMKSGYKGKIKLILQSILECFV